MRYCSKCNLSIVHSSSGKCPLCTGILSETTDAADCSASCLPQYPQRTTSARRGYNLVFRLILLLSIVTASTSVLVNIFTYKGTLWSLIIVGIILFMWITVAYPLFVRRNIGHIIVVDVITVCVMLYIIEAVTHTRGWGLNFTIPFLLIAATFIITLIILLQRLNWREYTSYQTVLIVLGFVPVVFYVSGLITTLWPSVASAFYSFLTLTGMFVFADKKYKNELIKRFHI